MPSAIIHNLWLRATKYWFRRRAALAAPDDDTNNTAAGATADEGAAAAEEGQGRTEASAGHTGVVPRTVSGRLFLLPCVDIKPSRKKAVNLLPRSTLLPFPSLAAHTHTPNTTTTTMTMTVMMSDDPDNWTKADVVGTWIWVFFFWRYLRHDRHPLGLSPGEGGPHASPC